MVKTCRNYYKISSILARIILLIVFLLPLCFTLSRAFFTSEGFTLNLVKEAFTSSYNYKILAFTIEESVYSAIISILIALPGAILFSTYDFKGKKIILSLSSLCFVLPSILVVLGFVIFYGNNGILNKILKAIFSSNEPVIKVLYSFKAIILAHAFLNFPIALTQLTTYMSNISKDQEYSSQLLGASKLKTFFSITLVRILPSLISSFLLIFLYCFTSFSIILILGGGPEFTTLEVEIYRTNNIVGNSTKAAALSVFALLYNIIIVVLCIIASKRVKTVEAVKRDHLRKVKSLSTKIILFIYITLLLIFILRPMLGVIYRSFVSTSNRLGTGFSFRSYQELFGLKTSVSSMKDAFKALLNSLIIGFASAFFATLLSLKLSLYITRMKSSLGEICSMLPMMVSSVTVALGFTLVRAKIPVRGVFVSYIFIMLAHFVIILPFALRTILPAARAIDENILYSSYLLGASTRKASKSVEIPLLRNVVIKAFSFSFALSIGEINATMTLSEGKITTLPLLLYRLINSYNYQGACAVGSILILIALIVFFISELIGGKNGKTES